MSAELDQLTTDLGRSSLRTLMDQVDDLHELVASRAVSIPEMDIRSVSVDRWKPPQPPQWPAIYCVLPDAPHTRESTQDERDSINLRARVATRHTNIRDELRQWELLVDVYRAVVDPALRQRTALTQSRNPQRSAMRWALDTWETPAGRVTALCMEFPFDIPLERFILRRPA